MSTSFRKIQSILLSSVVFALVSCGGASKQKDDTPTPTVDILVGKLIDSAVQGVRFQTATQSGITDEDGQFQYIEGEQVTFSIGDIQFPSVVAKNTLTPLDLFMTTNIEFVGVVNMARLLQSLDTDGVASNGIVISELAHSQSAGAMVDFTSEEFDQQVETIVANSGGVHIVLISPTEAIAHLQMSLDDLNNNCRSEHSKVGYEGEFSTFSHEVSGKATIINDCTIEVSMFNYDGEGPQVYFYAGVERDFSNVNAFSVGEELSGSQFDNATFRVTLPENKTLDDFDSFSVWCVEFGANFGDLVFSEPF